MSALSPLWDFGTAYDLFISQQVIYNPSEFDVRGVWAAGIRSRIPAPHRHILAQGLRLFEIPMSWIYHLQGNKDCTAVLTELKRLDPVQRLAAMAFDPSWPPEYSEILANIASKGFWIQDDSQEFNAIYRQHCQQMDKKPLSSNLLIKILDTWANAAEFGEQYYDALNEYCDVFFYQEERRIHPLLQIALRKAQLRSERLPLNDLLEELTKGIRFEKLPHGEQAILAPSYWGTPLVYFAKVAEGSSIYIFGGRPEDVPLVPGDTVPDALLRALKALSDSTRLQMLQYLSERPYTPTELSRRLRLRGPTITHHLKILRLAGLVRLTLGDAGITKHYTARQEAVQNAFGLLTEFISSDQKNSTIP